VQKILQDIRHATDRAVMATEEGTKGVDAGVLRAQRTNEVMHVLSDVIHESVLASRQIVAAVRQEAAGIDQVNTAMGEIQKASQQFASATQQTEQANTDLASLAEQLNKSIKLYKV